MKAILIIFLSYLLIKYLAKILVPIILKHFAKKMQDKFNQQHNNQTSHKDGEVTIEKHFSSDNKKSNKVGDYVDFEELEE